MVLTRPVTTLDPAALLAAYDRTRGGAPDPLPAGWRVDASDNSRPILERLGFVRLVETVPYVFTPPKTRESR